MKVTDYEIKILERMKHAIGKGLKPDNFFLADEFPDRELLNAILLKYKDSDVVLIHAVGIPQRVDLIVPKPGCILKLEELKEKVQMELNNLTRFSTYYINSLMQIFKLRDNVNLHFKSKFGFKIFKLEQEGVIPEIIKPCENENNFATKIASLANLVDWVDVENLKFNIQGETKGDKSITLLEKFLRQTFATDRGKIIRNLRIISELRNKKFPIHKEGEEVIEIFRDLGEKYPPENWDNVWKKILALYIETLDALIQLF